MTNYDYYCCNPFKQRNHKPESWRVLPVTKSLREQFRLYLGEDENICLTCKRKLYETLPNVNVKDSQHDDSIIAEIEEMGYWSGELKTETHLSNKNYEDLSVDDRLWGYQLIEDEKNYHRTDQRRGITLRNVSQIAVVSSTNDYPPAIRSTHRPVAFARKVLLPIKKKID